MSLDSENRHSPEPARKRRSPRPGRERATTHGELSHVALTLFLKNGFDETTIDDIVRAAGIGRRTFFRYFSTKNELPWGHFDELLDTFREVLGALDAELPLAEALRQGIVSFNTFPDEELPYHRSRMWLLLNVPSLSAYSMLKYASWREVIAEFVARRRGGAATDLAPQTIAWICLGVSLTAYEQWLTDEGADLLALLEDSFRAAQHTFAGDAV